jgi:hypothetical protein
LLSVSHTIGLSVEQQAKGRFLAYENGPYFCGLDAPLLFSLRLVGGNSVDLFCDPGSTITGSVNLSGVPTAQCTNLLSGETVALP